MNCLTSLLFFTCFLVIREVCGQNEFEVNAEKARQACRDAQAILGDNGDWKVNQNMLVSTRSGRLQPRHFLGATNGTGGLGKAPRDRPRPRMGGNKRTTVLPKSYSVREKFGASCPSMNQVLTQGCGNCWAMASTTMINDRYCMNKPAGSPDQYVSAKSLTQCFPGSCRGANPGAALRHWVNNGIPTGGETKIPQTPAGCQPFEYNFAVEDYTCTQTCADGSSASPDQLSKGRVAYSIENDSTKIMEEIYNFGPVVATFEVFLDFTHCYKSGIYRHVAGDSTGVGHAVKVYGWGEENGVLYWLAHNSWGSYWGENGFFRIYRGTNEAGFESYIVAAIPELGQAETTHDCEDDTTEKLNGAPFCDQFVQNLLLCDSPRLINNAKELCKKTCQYCKPRGPICMDSPGNENFCKSIFLNGQCDADARTKDNCKKTCAFCEGMVRPTIPPVPCLDDPKQAATCAELAQEELCAALPMAKTSCKKSCNYC